MTPQSHPLARDPMRVPWAAFHAQRARRREMLGALNFIEAFERCPECVAAGEAASAQWEAEGRRIRDRGLLRRDLNEAFEILTLETLS